MFAILISKILQMKRKKQLINGHELDTLPSLNCPFFVALRSERYHTICILPQTLEMMHFIRTITIGILMKLFIQKNIILT